MRNIMIELNEQFPDKSTACEIREDGTAAPLDAKALADLTTELNYLSQLRRDRDAAQDMKANTLYLSRARGRVSYLLVTHIDAESGKIYGMDVDKNCRPLYSQRHEYEILYPSQYRAAKIQPATIPT